MTFSSAPTSASEPDCPEWARLAYEEQLAMARELAQLGLAVAREIKRQVTEPDPQPGAAIDQLALGFDRVSRAVRLSLMLQDRTIRHMLGEDAPAPPGGKEPEEEPITEIRRIIIYPDHPEHPYNEHAERERSETGDRPDRERPVRPPASDFAQATVEEIRTDLDAASHTAWPTPPDSPEQRRPRYRPLGGGGGSSGGWQG